MLKRIQYIVPLIIFSLLISCKSFDNKLLEKKEYFDNSVLPMKVVINQASVEKCHNSMFNKISTTEVADILRQNLLFESTPGNIYLSVIVRYNKLQQKLYFSVGVFPLLLMGAPAGNYNFTITLEAAIMKPNGQILKTYTSTATDFEYVCGTGHYAWDDDSEAAALYYTLQLACKDLREQLKNDAETINKLAR